MWTEYKLVICDFLNQVEDAVSFEMVNGGWIPIGGVTQTYSGDYIQAMVK